MDTNPRQLQILAIACELCAVSIDKLSDMFGVTLRRRRDVRHLSESGLLTRFHGGVRLPGSAVKNIAYQTRGSLNAEGKVRIARAAAARMPSSR